MTDELNMRAERAIADLESAGAFLRGPFFEAVVCKAVAASIAATQSPYVDRAGAAARWRCSESEIDRAAKAGVKAAKVEGRVKKTPARMAEFNWGVFQ